MYAKDTSVSVERSRAELEQILMRYGATGFGSAWQGDKQIIMFVVHNKQVKFVLQLPEKLADEFTHWKHASGRLIARTPEQAYKLWEQSCRQRWRALCLCVKAKLEAIEAGITNFEYEFMAHFVMPNGKVLGEEIVPQIEVMSKTGKMPQLLLGM